MQIVLRSFLAIIISRGGGRRYYTVTRFKKKSLNLRITCCGGSWHKTTLVVIKIMAIVLGLDYNAKHISNRTKNSDLS